ncbi:MAG: 2-phosphosulfolactate phosphatase [Firmicutes bacterium]|nr:2-phosphosulfolactate phosphatase [Bacillota bacterium]
MVRIDVALVPQEIEARSLNGITAIVIDVLRASTTIACAISNGCDEVIPTISVEEAVEISRAYARGDYLLCGERRGEKIEGFDLGNSPLEYTEDRVAGKKIIMTTTNGTGAIRAVKAADDVIVGSCWNLSAACERAVSLGKDILIVCAGEGRRFALEDAVCAGMMCERIASMVEADESDGCIAARRLYAVFRDNIQAALAGSEHARYLARIGFSDDVAAAAQVDRVGVVPVLHGGHIVRRAE